MLNNHLNHFYLLLLICFIILIVGDNFMKKKFLDSSISLIVKNKDYSDEQIEIMAYGLEAVYLTVSKMIVIFSLAYL